MDNVFYFLNMETFPFGYNDCYACLPDNMTFGNIEVLSEG